MMEEFDPRDLHEIDGEYLEQSAEQAKVSWFTRWLLAMSLNWGFNRLTRELAKPGLEASKKAHALFDHVERVDIVPSQSGMRGFRLVLDGLLSLYFSQEDDHFVYDGFEIGIFEDCGDVTVFD